MIIEEVIEVREDSVYGVYVSDPEYGDDGNGLSVTIISIDDFKKAKNYKDFSGKIK